LRTAAVDHQILLNKLHHYGIRGVANDLFGNYRNNRKQLVFVNQQRSNLCGITIEQVEGIKYLGFVIDSQFNWNLHIAHEEQKVICGGAALYKLQPYANVDLLHKVNFSIVYCHLHYTILIWGTANKTLLDFLVVIITEEHEHTSDHHNYHTQQMDDKILTIPLCKSVKHQHHSVYRGYKLWNDMSKDLSSSFV